MTLGSVGKISDLPEQFLWKLGHCSQAVRQRAISPIRVTKFLTCVTPS